MRVEEIMTREVEACRPDDTLNTAADIMWQTDCGCVPVIDGSSKRVIGMITDRDICMAAYLSGQPLQALTIEGAMAKTVYSCNPQDPLATAERIMREAQIRRLPAVDEHGRLVGIISLSDIAMSATIPAHDRGDDQVHQQATSEQPPTCELRLIEERSQRCETHEPPGRRASSIESEFPPAARTLHVT